MPGSFAAGAKAAGTTTHSTPTRWASFVSHSSRFELPPAEPQERPSAVTDFFSSIHQENSMEAGVSEDIRAAVREKYGKVAASVTSGATDADLCCGSSSCCG